LCERADEKETFCRCQRSEIENAEGFEQHQHGRVPEMLSAFEGVTCLDSYWP